MKKLKLLFFSGTIMFLFSILLFSCSDEQLESEVVSDFQVEAEYQKKITVTDKSGLNSITLGISSNNLEAFNLRTKEVFTLNTLTMEELIALESEDNEPTATTSNQDFPSIEEAEKNAVHIEILDKQMGKNVAALDLITTIPTEKANGWKSGWHWHYSWAAKHYFKITCNAYVDLAVGFQYTNPSWPNNWNWSYTQVFNFPWSYSVTSPSNKRWNNNIDTRALVISSSYHYLVL